jgi:hypothetical protein
MKIKISGHRLKKEKCRVSSQGPNNNLWHCTIYDRFSFCRRNGFLTSATKMYREKKPIEVEVQHHHPCMLHASQQRIGLTNG